jgi:hypothetical protein
MKRYVIRMGELSELQKQEDPDTYTRAWAAWCELLESLRSG